MTLKAEREVVKAEAIEQLRGIFPPGSTAKTILRHVTRSGMSRSISVVSPDGAYDVDYLLVRAGIGGSFDQKNGGIKVGGCGMDMGFSLVYGMSHTLYRDGFGCIGAGDDNWTGRCPSNDHSNGDRDYTEHGRVNLPSDDPRHEHEPIEHWHSDGGYAVSQRWL